MMRSICAISSFWAPMIWPHGWITSASTRFASWHMGIAREWCGILERRNASSPTPASNRPAVNAPTSASVNTMTGAKLTRASGGIFRMPTSMMRPIAEIKEIEIQNTLRLGMKGANESICENASVYVTPRLTPSVAGNRPYGSHRPPSEAAGLSLCHRCPRRGACFRHARSATGGHTDSSCLLMTPDGASRQRQHLGVAGARFTFVKRKWGEPSSSSSVA